MPFTREKQAPSPYINRFLSADTVVPNAADPQAFNRYAYAYNNPLRYIDPNGHASVCGYSYSDPDCSTFTPKTTTVTAINPKGSLGGKTGGGGSGGGSGGSNNDGCNAGDTCVGFTTTEFLCDNLINDCATVATDLGIIGTGLDSVALMINAPFGAAAVASVATILAGDPAGVAAYTAVYKAYQPVKNISNYFGWAGFGAWAGQGLVTGDNQLGFSAIYTSDGSLKQIGVSGSLAQDTIFSFLNDTLALKLDEPITATIWSGVGVEYDFLRNPFNPSASYLPTGVQPNGNISYNFETGSLTGNFSIFPPGP